MSAIKPIIRQAREAVLDGMAHARNKLHQLADNLTDHLDNLVKQVRDQDNFHAPGGTHAPNVPNTHRPGFNADGSVNPDDFRTPRDGAYYWSGMYPRPGADIAGNIAGSNNATTLEQLIDARGIEMPEWDDSNPAVVETWTRVSDAYAAGASGTVHAVLGDNIRPNAVWWTELTRLQANDGVDQVIRIDPDTLAESVIWSR